MKTHNNDTHIKTENGDLELLTELADVCKTGEAFYSTVASDVEHQALRNQLFSMADLRSGIVNSLAHENVEPRSEALTQTADHLKRWYHKAPEKYSDFENREFLETTEDREQQYLSLLRRRVSRVRNQRYAKILANKIASIQIMHDQLKRLKDTFN